MSSGSSGSNSGGIRGRGSAAIGWGPGPGSGPLAGVQLPNGRAVRGIADRLSLRPPQRQALELLDLLCGAGLPAKPGSGSLNLQDWAAKVAAALPAGHSFREFEREFVSLAFALATGVGKTRLMGAMVAYLHLVQGINNFFVLAPNLTIYNKLILDFQPGNAKYVLRGLPEFVIDPPRIVTGDDYADSNPDTARLFGSVVINVFNISKINSEVRGGREPRIHKVEEVLGQSYFAYLQALSDLVLFMDESHRYRASAGVRAINELRPRLGIELTATPYVESSKGPVAFRNIVQNYPLSRAIDDGFVKVPAVVTRENFHPAGLSAAQLEKIKLEDGVRLHESVKADLQTYALESGRERVKPFMLVIARDTTHAAELLTLIESPDFFGGQYAGKAIQIDYTAEDLMIERLLKIEKADEITEIVIHVNMLKEGWDVTNLYTIVPLRAANARVLIEQTIGRGLRLPYGVRVGRPRKDAQGRPLADPVDRLNIVAHDRFQEIIDEANSEGSLLRIETFELTEDGEVRREQTFVSQPGSLGALGLSANLSPLAEQQGAEGQDGAASTESTPHTEVLAPVFRTLEGQRIAAATVQAVRDLSRELERVPNAEALLTPEAQQELVERVQARLTPVQPTLLDVETAALPPAPDLAGVVRQATEVLVRGTISIPRIMVVPEGEIKTLFAPFTLDLSGVNYQAPDTTLVAYNLRDNSQERLGGEWEGGIRERRVEDLVVRAIMRNAEVSYADNADTLYALAGQVVAHFRARGDDDRAIEATLLSYEAPLSSLIFKQMREHQKTPPMTYVYEVRQGLTELRPGTLTAGRGGIVTNTHQVPPSGTHIRTCLYTGFRRSLYPQVKFDSIPELRLAQVLEREAEKWFRPVAGQFQIHYHYQESWHPYQPDFVAETQTELLLLEVKASHELSDLVVQEKARVARQWCAEASRHAARTGGKPWRYHLISDNVIQSSSTLEGLMDAVLA